MLILGIPPCPRRMTCACIGSIHRAPSRYVLEHARPRANASIARASSSSCPGEAIGCRTPPTLILRSDAPPGFWECAHTQKERMRPSRFLLPECGTCDVPLYSQVQCVVPKGTREDHRRHHVLCADPRAACASLWFEIHGAILTPPI